MSQPGDTRAERRIALLTGGSTPERPVALAGAGQVTAALRARGFEVNVFDTCSGKLDAAAETDLLSDGVGRSMLEPEELEGLRRREDLVRLVGGDELRSNDVVWPLLHGRQGEGGQVQSLLESNGLPYVGSDARGSELAMDKEVAKVLMRDRGIPTADWSMARGGDYDRAAVASLGYPLIVKPSRVGSTVGLTLVRSPEQLAPAVERASGYDTEVVFEAFLPGRELTVGVLEGRALAVGEIRTAGDIFDYESKYQPGEATEIFPAEIPQQLADRVAALALKVHDVLKLRDFCRVDFRLDRAGEPMCMEANTLPGMTATSLLPQSAAAAGIGFGDLCELLVELALSRA